MTSIKQSVSKVVKIITNRSGMIESKHVNLAANFLNNSGGVVVLPTDTIYGLAAKVDDNKALDRIYEIKGRSKEKPLAVSLYSIDDIDKVAETSQLQQGLFSRLYPGQVTLLLKRSKNLNPKLNPGVDTIGVRIPDNNFIRAVTEITGPLALTSANRSGEANPLSVEEFEDIWDSVDCVFDNYVLQRFPNYELSLGSTIIDLSRGNRYSTVRKGCDYNRIISLLNRFGYIEHRCD